MRANPITSALLLVSILVSGSTADAATTAPAQPVVQVRDGSHDFDFLYGNWKIHNRLLEQQPDGSRAWQEFEAKDDCHALADDLGNLDYYRTDHWKDFVGISIRLYNPTDGQWSIYWSENDEPGVIQSPPVVGSFKGDTGVFVVTHEKDGKTVMVRYTWIVQGKDKARWEHAVSRDKGATWETDWTMDFTRIMG